ncbi:MAG: orotidine-5'-phosphate decarboxylase [Acidimicrobiia bacterium]
MVIPVLVALDFASLTDAEALARRLLGKVAGFKVGLELLMGHGAEAVDRIAILGAPVFADAKLHDIPNTVQAAARQLASAGARWLTVHGSGGDQMVAAAVTGMAEVTDGETGVLVVTALTSLDDEDLRAMGIAEPLTDHVVRMAEVARRGGAEGVVCSPAEASLVKSRVPGLMVVTPGVRLTGGEFHDQRRVGTPRAALEAGSDLLVMGRAITAATDPAAVVDRLAWELDR